MNKANAITPPFSYDTFNIIEATNQIGKLLPGQEQQQLVQKISFVVKYTPIHTGGYQQMTPSKKYAQDIGITSSVTIAEYTIEHAIKIDINNPANRTAGPQVMNKFMQNELYKELKNPLESIIALFQKGLFRGSLVGLNVNLQVEIDAKEINRPNHYIQNVTFSFRLPVTIDDYQTAGNKNKTPSDL